MSDKQESWMRWVVDAPQARTLARPPEHEVRAEEGVRVPMRDGTLLGAMLWRPASPGRYPVLIERGPHRLEGRTGPAGQYYAARGYVVLGVSLRGCGESGGKFGAADLGSPGGDGYDTVAWAAAQPWSSGRIGTLCGSISGYTSYQAATEAPPHLTALFVREGPCGFQGPLIGSGGALGLSSAQFVIADWLRHRLDRLGPPQRELAERMLQRYQEAWQAAGQPTVADPHDPGHRAPIQPVTPFLEHLPLAPHPLFTGVADEYNDLVTQSANPRLESRSGLAPFAERVRAPICHLGAWYDSTVVSTLSAYGSISQHAALPLARAEGRLVIGPWVHGPQNVGQTRTGLLDMGPQAALDLMAFRGRWYDHYLLDRPSGMEHDPRVWLYLVGTDRWLGFGTWPPEGVVEAPWYLGAGDAEGARLDAEPPSATEQGDDYAYDPAQPTPALAGGGAFGMAMDEGPLEHRLLCYTSAPLRKPLALVGPVKAVLHAASSAPDTDWVVRLSWVRPDGAAIVLSGGILRARFRAGWNPVPLEPGVPARCEVAMLPLAVLIPTGHRLRLSVTSSDFPEFDRNLNTGAPLGRESRVATNTIYHDASRPSCLILPVLR